MTEEREPWGGRAVVVHLSAFPQASKALLSVMAQLLDPSNVPSYDAVYLDLDRVLFGFKTADPRYNDERLAAAADEIHLAMQIAEQVLEHEPPEK
jgi:hypothetical protein